MKKLHSRAKVGSELLHFIWKERMWWMAPFVITLLIVGLLLVFAQTSPIIPFLYTAF